MRKSRGYLYIAAAAALWGGSATFVKYLLNVSYDPLIIVQTRTSISFLLLVLYFLFTDRAAFKFDFKDIGHIALVGIGGVAGANYFYYFAMQESTVGTAILIQYSAPILVALYAFFVQKEKLHIAAAAAVLLSSTGIFFAVGAYRGNAMTASPKAVLFASIAAACYALFTIAGKSLRQKYPMRRTLLYALGAAAFFWLFINSPMKIIEAGYSAEDWAAFTVVSVSSVLLPYGFYLMGLHYLSPTKVIVTSTLEPIIAIIAEFLFLGTSMSLIQIAGAAGVLGAIFLLQMQPSGGERS